MDEGVDGVELGAAPEDKDDGGGAAVALALVDGQALPGNVIVWLAATVA